jgi:hypothetical protein
VFDKLVSGYPIARNLTPQNNCKYLWIAVREASAKVEEDHSDS